MPARNFTTPRRNNLGYSERGAAAIRRRVAAAFFFAKRDRSHCPAGRSGDAPQVRGYKSASTFFSSPGKQKRSCSQRGEHRRSDEPGPKDERARVEIALRVSSHSDQKKQQRGVDQN